MSPMQIEMMLHFHCSGEPWPRKDAPAYRDSIGWMEDEKLITRDPTDDRWTLTDRGRAYVFFLTSLPLPKATWSLPTGESISQDELP